MRVEMSRTKFAPQTKEIYIYVTSWSSCDRLDSSSVSCRRKVRYAVPPLQQCETMHNNKNVVAVGRAASEGSKKGGTSAFHPRAGKKERQRKQPANEINRTTRAPFASGVPEPAQHAWIGAWVTHRVLAVERQWLWLVVNLRRSQLAGFMRETKMEKTAGKSVRRVREERYGRKPRGN